MVLLSVCARWGLCEIGACVYGRGGGDYFVCVCVLMMKKHLLLD